MFLPEVTSFVNIWWFAYKIGFIQPRGLLPAFRRAALTREIMPATAGAAAEVPDTKYWLPPIIINMACPSWFKNVVFFFILLAGTFTGAINYTHVVL